MHISPIPPDQRLLVSVEEAAQLASVSASTMYRYIQAGEIRSIKRGRVRRVIVASLREWIGQNTAEAE